MGLTDEVREGAARIAESARFVSIEMDALDAIEPAPPPVLDAERHYLEGPREDVAAYLFALDAINFGSGWFPTLRKRPGCSGYYTVAWGLADHWRASGPLGTSELQAMNAGRIGSILAQDPEHELMALYAEALRDLGDWLGDRSPLEAVGDSAEELASSLVAMPFFDDRGFWKRAQITANDLQLAGIADFADIDRLTIFADNLVPHVLRIDGVLRFDPDLLARIDDEELLEHDSPEEVEIRACAVEAVERLVAEHGATTAADADNVLWHRGAGPRYKARPRHRARTTAY